MDPTLRHTDTQQTNPKHRNQDAGDGGDVADMGVAVRGLGCASLRNWM